MPVNPATTAPKLITLPHAMTRAIENFRFEHRIKAETEAIRRPIELGLDAARGKPARKDRAA